MWVVNAVLVQELISHILLPVNMHDFTSCKRPQVQCYRHSDIFRCDERKNAQLPTHSFRALDQLTRWLVCLPLGLAVASLQGCVGAMVVGHALSVHVSGEANGEVWTASPQQVTELPKPAGLAPFPSIGYNGDVFGWEVSTGNNGIGSVIKNHSAAQLCFRLDQARMNSNFNDMYQPLRAMGRGLYFADGKRDIQIASRQQPPQQHLKLEPLCLPPGGTIKLTLSPDYEGLFPNKTLFNATWPENEARIIERGIGNWLGIEIPLEREGKSEVIRFKLTSTDIRTRTSYF
jgi:hypothetical protein